MSESNLQVESNVKVSIEASRTSENDSEYESVDEGGEDRRKTFESENGSNNDLSTSEDERNISLRREEGDGQESLPSKKVDDDEDKKNPQYIPKRGTFYEHDDRTADDIEDPEVAEAEKEKDGKKKVWQDKKERWTHDKYNDSEQAPKSKSELVSIYGYDIRNEDGPPRARRRRRYGRGPNKYTRNWEDEDAYGKPAPVPRPKKPIRKPRGDNEEFPPLLGSEQTGNETRVDESEEVWEPQNNRVSNMNQANQEPTPVKQEPPEKTQPEHQNNKTRPGTGRVVKPQREIKDSDYKGFAKSRQYKTSKTEQQILPRKPRNVANEDVILSQNFTNMSHSHAHYGELEGEMSKMSLQEKGGKFGGPRQGSVPPRMQGEQKASKRYSSLRQRSLPETANPPFGQHAQGYYTNAEYAQQLPPQQSSAVHPATTQVPQIAPPPLPTIQQQVTPVTATQILQAPPPYAPPFAQAPPPFLQAGVAPAPFIPQQTPQLINYVQSQPQFSQPTYQGFQQPFNPVTQPPAELYQPQGGITYYSMQEQQVARAVPQKRPKAAIPILPPPPEPRGRGREIHHAEFSPNDECVGPEVEISGEYDDADGYNDG